MGELTVSNVATASAARRPDSATRDRAAIIDPEQQARLVAAKVRALSASVDPSLRDSQDATESTFVGGAGLISGKTGWFYANEDPVRSVGRALVWAQRHDVEDLNIIVDDCGGEVARRAAQFSCPPQVFRADGGSLIGAVPTSPVIHPQPPVEALDLVPLLADAGVEIVIEHGVVRGEILGLEVARIVADDTSGPRIEVGVGRHDREAFAMVHGDVPAPQALAAVVESVRRHRRAGRERDLPEHPLGRMAPERWLRKIVMDQPERVGAERLDPLEPVIERKRVDEVQPALLIGISHSGNPMVVACSTGIDLDLVPTAADARAAYSNEADLVIMVPECDAHPVVHALAARLRLPATVVTVPAAWRSWSALN